MVEYVAPAAVKIVADSAKEYASPYFGYFFSYEKIVEDFKNQRKELELRKQRLDTRVGEATTQNEIIYKDVEDWLETAKKELEETQKLKDEIDRVKCFKWCPKWGWRYSLSKKLAEEIPNISKLLTSNFVEVGYRRPLQGIEFITSTNFMDSESSKSAFNQIMEAINAKGVNMIGLHGMPGVGKTTLAQEVGKHAREQKLFDKVVMFTMSQNPNIKNIQDKVADILGLKFKASSQDGKAEELLGSMQRENKILVIVDDLWEEFKLESIGIPFGDHHKGCKILLTTRHQQVCTKMNCQKEIQLGILSEDEAWALFRDKAGLDDDSSTLNDVAKEVADQCKGLPLAIVVVAKALKGESLNGWTTVNQRFKDSRHSDNEEVLGGVLTPLKVSYDYLKKGNNQMTVNDIQMCFLLCSLFPEDEEIFIEKLIICGIGVGLFPNVYSIEDKRNEIGIALKNLLKSGLLLETDDAERIRMHDVVRDFAHWITSTGETRFMVKDKLKEWPDMVESFECYTAIALWHCSSNIKNFPDKVEFSKLKTLFLQGERKWKWKGDDLLVVSSTFFEEMKGLQVLYLESVYFSLKGFHSLPNLKTFWCEYCKLENFSSSLTNMRSLEIIALIWTEIDEISEELVKLSTLKYLRLFYVGVEEMKIPPKLVSSMTGIADQNDQWASYAEPGAWNVEEEEEDEEDEEEEEDEEDGEEEEEVEEVEMKIPPKLVSRLTSLQELHVISNNNINLLELNSLSRLTALSLKLSTNQFSQEDFVFPKLQRYNIDVGGYNFNFQGALTIRRLGIKNFSSSLSAFKNLFCNAGKLKLNNISGLKNIVPSIEKEVLNELTSLELYSCNDMEFLIDITRDQGSTVALSNLVELTIRSMVSLKGLCYGLSPSRRAIASFTRLKVVTIEFCDELKTIFSPCIAQSMLCIEELYIDSCDGLEQVIGFAQEEDITKNDSHLCCCPKLRILDIRFCKSLKYVCANTSTQGLQSLESVKIISCPQLMRIFKMEQNENGQDVVLPQNHCWPKLKTLLIEYCQLFSCFIVQAPLLEDLSLRNVGIIWKADVPILNEDCIVVGDYEKVFQVQSGYSFSRIKELDLRALFEMRIIWNDFAQVVTLENLTTLVLRDCKKLRYIFSPTMALSLSHLVNLSINGCEEIERLILANDQISSSASSNDGLQPISFPNLTTITITNCRNLKSLFPFGSIPVLPKLECLEVKKNSKLEQLFELEDEPEVVAEEEMKFDKLEKLSIEELPSLIHFGPKGYHFALPALEYLKVRDCPKLTTNFSINSQEFVHYETKESMANFISLQLGSFLELICTWNGSNHCINLCYLETIKITGCGKLTYLFSEFTARTLVHLKLLYVRNCFSLEHLIEEVQKVDEIDVSNMKNNYPWPKLENVDIRKCKNLKYLFSSILTEGLPDLKSIKIEDCPRLVQIFNMEKNKDGFGLQNHCWPELRTLRIVNCQILKYVFTNTLSHGFPLLESVYLKNCSQLQVFSPTEERDVIGDHILLNMPRLRNLSVSNCPQFSCLIVQAQLIEVLVLSNVGNSCQLLNVDLPILNEDCIVVGNHEEVFQVSSSSSNGDTGLQPISFPNLKKIIVTKCENLKSLFPFGSIPVLPKLESLIVKRNSKLEQVFKLEEEAEVVAEEMKFEKLKWLTFEELPSLIHFCLKGCHFVLPALIELKVRDCPKLSTGFFIDSLKFVHGKTKTPQFVEEDAIEESAIVSNAIFNENISWSRRGFSESQLPHIT